jgi:hypothetical protein
LLARQKSIGHYWYFVMEQLRRDHKSMPDRLKQPVRSNHYA